MEGRVGHDFGAVRVHADATAAASANQVGAAAYTVGRHVVFGAGRYHPETADGARLLAHELAHTLQQAHVDAPGGALAIGRPDDRLEVEARGAADAVTAGSPPGPLSAGPGVIARQSRPDPFASPALERARGFVPGLRPRASRAPASATAFVDAPAAGVTPCLQGTPCEVRIPGSAADYSRQATAEEQATRRRLGAQGAIVDAPEFLRFFQSQRPLPSGVQGIVANPALDTPTAPSMGLDAECRTGNPPTPRPGGACIVVPAYLERAARQFNAGAQVITADQRCVARARPLEGPFVQSVTEGGQTVRGCTRELWLSHMQAGTLHEGGHEQFDQTRPAPAVTGEVARFELNELFAAITEWPAYFQFAASQLPPDRRAAYLRDHADVMVGNGQEDVRGILTKLRCLHPCPVVDAAVREIFAAATTGWPREVRDSLLAQLADPARRLRWPMPPPPSVSAPSRR